MNIEEYISSGILEAYVMDQLSPAERTEVEQAVALHPEIREELDAIERSMESLAFATMVEPPVGIKEKLMARVDKDASDQKEAHVVQMQTDRSYGILKFAAAASVMIALASAVMAFTYWKKWQGAEGRLADMIAQNAQFAENYNHVNQQLDNIQNAVSIMNNTAYKRVVMAGTDNAPDAQATVYWNETTADVYLSIQNLKELSQDQQYQLWAIIDGKPVDAGVFDPNTGNFLVQMKNITSGAAAFAVTIEPRGGSENPSLETMQVVGNV